jgi:cold shock CspA family protein
MVRISTLLLGMFVLALLLGRVFPAMADEAKGKVKTVNGDKNEFVITDSTGKDITIHLNQNGKVLVNDKAAKLTDLQAGDLVTVTCEIKNEQHQASEVRATRQAK